MAVEKQVKDEDVLIQREGFSQGLKAEFVYRRQVMDNETAVLKFIKKIAYQSEIDMGYSDRLWLIRNLTTLIETQVKAERERIVLDRARSTPNGL